MIEYSGIGESGTRVGHCKVNAGAQINHQFSPDLRKDTALVMLHRHRPFIKSILGQKAFTQLQLEFSFKIWSELTIMSGRLTLKLEEESNIVLDTVCVFMAEGGRWSFFKMCVFFKGIT